MWRLKQFEDRNAKLKTLVADLSLDKAMKEDVLRRKLSPQMILEMEGAQPPSSPHSWTRSRGSNRGIYVIDIEK